MEISLLLIIIATYTARHMYSGDATECVHGKGIDVVMNA